MSNKARLKGPIKFYILFPLISIFIFLGVDIALMFGHVLVGIIASILTIIYAVAAISMYNNFKNYEVEEMVKFAKELNQAQGEQLKKLSVPYAVVEGSFVIWANDKFLELFEEKIKEGQNLAEKLPHLSESISHMISKKKDITHIKYNEKVYKIELKALEADKKIPAYLGKVVHDVSKCYGIYFYDETSLCKYKQESEDKSLVTGLLYIDNFDEIIEAVDEVDQSYTIALIDRKIAGYIHRFDGICKKMENDKYFVVLNAKSLARMEIDRFSIVGSIRELSSEINVTPTISIGIGAGGETYQDCYRYSRMAIEMAISRGGDQAVVKEGVDIRYYGGKSEKETKNNRVKARVKAEALRDLLLAKDSIYVMGHKMSDVDSLGAAVGISCIAKSLGKKVKIVLNDETISVKPLMDRFRDDENYNDHVFVNSSTALSIADPNALVIVVDTNRPSLVECEGLLRICKTVVVIDHHRKSSDSFESVALSYIESYASSASEMVTELIRYISDDIKLTPIEADSMYAGIMIDTNNFLTKTGVRTFEAAAFLRRNGVDVSRVRKIFRDDIDSYQAKAETVKQAEVYKKNFAISIFPRINIPNPTIIGAQAANELLNIDSVKASFVFTEYKGKVYLSARSIDEVNVQYVTEKLGGGGHMSIAGAQFTNMSVFEAKKKLTEVLDEMLSKGDL